MLKYILAQCVGGLLNYSVYMLNVMQGKIYNSNSVHTQEDNVL